MRTEKDDKLGLAEAWTQTGVNWRQLERERAAAHQPSTRKEAGQGVVDSDA